MDFLPFLNLMKDPSAQLRRDFTVDDNMPGN